MPLVEEMRRAMPRKTAMTMAYDQTVERTERSLIHSERTMPTALRPEASAERGVVEMALIELAPRRSW
jgi:hypothetical protein